MRTKLLRDFKGDKVPLKAWLQHWAQCDIEADPCAINGLWWGWCRICGRRHARDLNEAGEAVGPWRYQ